MNRCFGLWTLGRPLILHDPEVEEKEGAETNSDPIGRETRGFVTDQIRRATQGLVRKEDFESSLNSFQEKLTGSLSELLGSRKADEHREETSSQPEKAKETKKSAEKSHETPDDVRLRRMEAEVAAERESRKALEETIKKEREQARVNQNRSALRAHAEKLGAQDPDLIVKDIIDNMIDDAEKGPIFETQGEYGKEFVSPDEYIKSYLEKKPFLRKAPTREGSGAGTGSSGSAAGGGRNSRIVGGREVTPEAMKDAKWYQANAPEIRQVLQGDMAKYQSSQQ